MKRCLCLLLLAIAAIPARADGGRLRLRAPAGPFVVTLFTSPDPLIAGMADFSVAVEQADRPGIVQDADVTLILTPVNGPAEPLTLHASHSQATSRFLQAANFRLPQSGRWTVTVIVQQGAETGRCSTQIDVDPEQPLTSRLTWNIAIVPIVLLLFLLHQWRKRSFQRGRVPAHTASSI